MPAFDDIGEEVDVVFIVDCCYSGTLVRGTGGASRIVEVLAACEASMTALENDSQAARVQNRTFTSKLADYAARRKGTSGLLAMAEMIEDLRAESPEVKPTHKIILGPSTVRIDLGQQRPSSPPATANPSYPNTKPGHRAVMSVHISDNLNDAKLKKLTDWVLSLNKGFGLTIDAVYKINSVGIIMAIPYSVLLQLDGLPGVQLIFEGCKSGNMARDLSREEEGREEERREEESDEEKSDEEESGEEESRGEESGVLGDLTNKRSVTKFQKQ